MNKSVALNQRLLPPTLLFICLLATLALRLFFPGLLLFPPAVAFSGGLVMLAGLVITTLGSQQFKKAHTPVKPLETPQRLVTDGLYRYTRNPMYLDFALILAGVWLLLGAISPVAGPLVFVVVTDHWYIPYEEQKLAALFGPAYRAYQAHVRRWI